MDILNHALKLAKERENREKEREIEEREIFIESLMELKTCLKPFHNVQNITIKNIDVQHNGNLNEHEPIVVLQNNQEIFKAFFKNKNVYFTNLQPKYAWSNKSCYYEKLTVEIAHIMSHYLKTIPKSESTLTMSEDFFEYFNVPNQHMTFSVKDGELYANGRIYGWDSGGRWLKPVFNIPIKYMKQIIAFFEL